MIFKSHSSIYTLIKQHSYKSIHKPISNKAIEILCLGFNFLSSNKNSVSASLSEDVTRFIKEINTSIFFVTSTLYLCQKGRLDFGFYLAYLKLIRPSYTNSGLMMKESSNPYKKSKMKKDKENNF
jgi:hypothetical protein